MGVDVYQLVEEPDWFSALSPRESRLLQGALAYHTLVRPGQRVRLTVLRTDGPHPPSLTDQSTTRIEWPSDRTVVGTIEAQATGTPVSATAAVDVVVDLGGPPESLMRLERPPGRVHEVRSAVRARIPVAFDVARQKRTDRLENRRLSRPIPRVGRSQTRGTGSASGSPRAVLFGLHWLELGGAEKWAAETVGMARDAGLVPIVLSDRPSGHPDIARPVFDDALVIPLSHPMTGEQESRLLSDLFRRFDVRGVHVHHCTWLYNRLPWIRAHYPGTSLVDSLHVLEWRTGGFVDIALRMSNVMDSHHVISPQLRDYLVDRQGLPREKVSLATLADLTVDPAGSPAVAAAPRAPGAPLTVAFVGRFTQQKRPYLFLRLAARLHKRLGDRVRFVMHGDGELAAEVRADHARLGLAGVVELRGTGRPVADTLAEADVLVISSDNEGVTLTSFEADAHGVLVLSADVGSQASVVPEAMLVPRAPLAFLAAAERAVVQLCDDPGLAARLLLQQRSRVDAFAALPRARDWTRALYERWAS
ncbi:glycosyltransferase [Trujillonella endophytica]|uniref:Glycosyltransferase involved in cell wall bisynthesis n=1 Tax=Trujillonella endophytica TaxID=673521 RepID=A0A1H8RWW7_9ACTN|nr:glycosyltransferase [Trujillella endophytica]SEO70786.1 Glycosyltransferase involved in cell wall bisynthesis [Trujillella endophytica]